MKLTPWFPVSTPPINGEGPWQFKRQGWTDRDAMYCVWNGSYFRFTWMGRDLSLVRRPGDKWRGVLKEPKA